MTNWYANAACAGVPLPPAWAIRGSMFALLRHRRGCILIVHGSGSIAQFLCRRTLRDTVVAASHLSAT